MQLSSIGQLRVLAITGFTVGEGGDQLKFIRVQVFQMPLCLVSMSAVGFIPFVARAIDVDRSCISFSRSVGQADRASLAIVNFDVHGTYIELLVTSCSIGLVEAGIALSHCAIWTCNL